MSDLPSPLTPPDCDLRDFPRMMIDIPRLRGSEFDASLNDSAWRAGFNLWLSAWHQVPAGSMPDDDAALAKAAGLGRDVRAWKKVRAEVLRTWVKCEDGLLYQPTVCEFALEAWIEKLAQAISSGAGNAKRWNVPFDPEPLKREIERTGRMLAFLNPKSKALRKIVRQMARQPTDDLPDEDEPESQRDADEIPNQSLGKGTGTGKGKEKGTGNSPFPNQEGANLGSTSSGVVPFPLDGRAGR